MTLNEGIASLMSSDPYNYALVHDSWHDGQYIQCSALSENQDEPRIQVFSKLGKDLTYSEQPFKRKGFALIKESGWRILSPTALIIYIQKYVDSEKLKNEMDSKYQEYRIPIKIENVFCILLSQYDIDLHTDEYRDAESIFDMFCSSYIAQINSEWSQDDEQCAYELFESFLLSKVSKSEHPGLYKILHHLGLTKSDLEWVHDIEMKYSIVVNTDGLEDFEQIAAIQVVRRRVNKALEKVGIDIDN